MTILSVSHLSSKNRQLMSMNTQDYSNLPGGVMTAAVDIYLLVRYPVTLFGKVLPRVLSALQAALVSTEKTG